MGSAALDDDVVRAGFVNPSRLLLIDESESNSPSCRRYVQVSVLFCRVISSGDFAASGD